MLDYISSIESSVRGYVRSFPTVFASSTGSWLTDSDGRDYLDFFSGAGALNYGHNNPLVKQSLIDYITSDGVMHSLDMATRAKGDFLQAFNEYILGPRNLDYKIQFTGPTGTNAVEAAVKLAKKATGRSHVVAFTNAYHGHTLGALALTGNRFYHNETFASHNNVTHLPFDGYCDSLDSTELLEKMLNDSSSGLPVPAAVIVETIQGEGGVNVASREWLENLSRICNAYNIVLIVDDIQVGNGRTGSFFSFESTNTKPSMVCLSKSIGGGLPMSLLLIDPSLDVWQPGEHTGTFRGNNLAFVAARAVLEYWKDNQFSRSINQHGEFAKKRLLAMTERFPQLNADVRGRGLIWGFDLRVENAGQRVSQLAFESGLIVETSGANDQVLKLLPPLTSTNEELTLGLDIIERSLEKIVQESKQFAVPSVVMPDCIPTAGPINH